jgi:tRNA C32,U32 (ribose-2'-O)-methylase TrmJ
LFGGERSGLDNDALDRCHAVVRIPTVASAPSMNLGQAVAVMAYELLRTGLDAAVVEPDERLLEGRQIEVLTDAAMRAMEKAGVNGQMTDAVRRGTFRRGLLRWKMTRADASWLQGLLERLVGRP